MSNLRDPLLRTGVSYASASWRRCWKYWKYWQTLMLQGNKSRWCLVETSWRLCISPLTLVNLLHAFIMHTQYVWSASIFPHINLPRVFVVCDRIDAFISYGSSFPPVCTDLACVVTPDDKCYACVKAHPFVFTPIFFFDKATKHLGVLDHWGHLATLPRHYGVNCGTTRSIIYGFSVSIQIYIFAKLCLWFWG